MIVDQNLVGSYRVEKPGRGYQKHYRGVIRWYHGRAWMLSAKHKTAEAAKEYAARVLNRYDRLKAASRKEVG